MGARQRLTELRRTFFQTGKDQPLTTERQLSERRPCLKQIGGKGMGRVCCRHPARCHPRPTKPADAAGNPSRQRSSGKPVTIEMDCSSFAKPASGHRQRLGKGKILMPSLAFRPRSASSGRKECRPPLRRGSRLKSKPFDWHESRSKEEKPSGPRHLSLSRRRIHFPVTCSWNSAAFHIPASIAT